MKDFEKKLEKLEAISEKMRTQSLPLDEAMKLFEEGTTLSKELDKEITRAERKVEKLLSEPIAEDKNPALKATPVRAEATAKNTSQSEPVEEPLFELFLD